MGQTESELHMRINLHRSNVNSDDKKYPTFEILHFRLHSFSNIRIEILAFEQDKKARLSKENDFMFKFRTIYPYGLNTIINNINIKKIANIYDLLNKFNEVVVINRGKRGSHKFSKSINYIIPSIWIKELEEKFIYTYNIKFVKAEIFKLKLNKVKGLKISFDTFKFKNVQFRDLVCDLINYRLLKCNDVESDIIYFKVKFQQKSFDNLNFNKIFKDIYNLFPIKKSKISIAYFYNNPLSTKICNYKEVAFANNVSAA